MRIINSGGDMKHYDRNRNIQQIITPPRNRGEVLFSLQFVCVCVCLCVCPALLVIKIPAERMYRYGRVFRQMVAYRTGSDPIEFGDLGSKVKVTVT